MTKMKLLELAFTMAYDAKVNYEDVFSQVRMWDNYIYVELLKRKIAIPPKKESVKSPSTQVHMSKNRFLDSMIGWSVLTLIVSTLTLLCSTISRPRRSKIPDIHQQPLIKYL